MKTLKIITLVILSTLSLGAQNTLGLTGPNTLIVGQTGTYTLTSNVPVTANMSAVMWGMTGFPSPTVVVAGTAVAASKQVACNLTITPRLCVLYGLNNNVISPGTLATIAFVAPATPGTITLLLGGVNAADKNGGAVTISPLSVPLTVTITASPFDLTSDGKVDVADLNAMVQTLLSGSCTGIDFNKDGVCSSTDVILMILAILGF